MKLLPKEFSVIIIAEGEGYLGDVTVCGRAVVALTYT